MMYTKFRFAKRIENLTPTMILEISAQAAKDPEVINLSVGQPDFPTPEPIKEAGIEAIRSNFTRYTAGSGIAELRQAVADHLVHNLSTANRAAVLNLCAEDKLLAPLHLDQDTLTAIARHIIEVCQDWQWM